ncbi:unannotated protein [freshwater metagenome]|uniref:Unannotated protein n=1 Tax=freshwater metagenome TaxID=449393 RepID=A0A6J6Z404_9ZZZZ|nr:hypothetical protein [Actinomycetota bacterium]MSW25402.1 hypothetical protein [Actinomycetota bacterium]MSX29882.1 hypothetical protein [Actinomycetota bacterium]MSX44093.1 hypothetical protein [Actinomycetota bacterium]MSX97973.1 hypothetical protein [Actinomycetota bacterium]
MTANTADSNTRQQVRKAIEMAANPISISEISSSIGLHENTIRGHLNVLLALGDIERSQLSATQRGRPKWLYTKSSRPQAMANHLLNALTVRLSEVGEHELVEEAAASWAAMLPSTQPAKNIDDAVANLATSLEGLGFTTELSSLGDAVAVSKCPYELLVGESPIICDIHTALASKILHDSGQPVSIASMEVFATKGVCIARLNRADQVPKRVIDATDY